MFTLPQVILKSSYQGQISTFLKKGRGGEEGCGVMTPESEIIYPLIAILCYQLHWHDEKSILDLHKL